MGLHSCSCNPTSSDSEKTLDFQNNNWSPQFLNVLLKEEVVQKWGKQDPTLTFFVQGVAAIKFLMK